MTVPKQIRDSIKEHLWAEADKLDWANLSAHEKAKFYSQWTETSSIGGELGLYMDPRQIRVYLKDTLLKSYARERLASPDRIFRVLEIESNGPIAEEYIKPHGRRLWDGRVIAWSRASEWKPTLLAVFEQHLTTLPTSLSLPSYCSRRQKFPLQTRRQWLKMPREGWG